MKSICLIIPPSPFLGDQKRNTPLGILYVAASLIEYGYDVQMADLRNVAQSTWRHDFAKNIPVCDVYGITATTPEYPFAVKIAGALRHRIPDAIVLGGMHVTAVGSADPVFDSVIIGEGEISILKLMNDVEAGTLQPEYRSPLIAPKKFYVSTLEPARHLLPEPSFINTELCEKGERATAIIASRGCPFDCSFCASSTMWNRLLRYRDPREVYYEIKKIIDVYGVRQFRFQDDTLTANKNWVIEFCDIIDANNLNIKWRANSRVDFMDGAVLQRMYDAGCYELDFGVEDISQRVLDINNKKVMVQDIYNSLQLTKDIGIKTRVFLMIGLPGQGNDVATKMIQFIEDVAPDAVDLSTFVPMPGSDVYNNPDKYGIVLHEDVDFSDYVFTLGLYGDEADRDFIFEHDVLENDELKMHRAEILLYIKKRNMVLNK